MLAGRMLHAGGPARGLLSRTILVVEDEELVRSTIVFALEDEGYEVLEAETAEAGLEMLEERAVTLLFTDIRLPGRMDGWALAEAARAIRPELPIVYATGYTAEAPRVVAGGVFLRKPYVPSTVIGAIRKLLGEE